MKPETLSAVLTIYLMLALATGTIWMTILVDHFIGAMQ